MDSNARRFPEISFVDTDTERLVNNLIGSYEIFTGRTLGDADPARLFILWIADIIMQERVIIDASAKQNVPRYAEGEFLDSLAEIFRDTERLRPRAAQTTLRFHISAPQISAQTIPSGTRVRADDMVTFATTETAVVPPGETYADAPAVCITTKPDPITGEEVTLGAAGNGFLPGQIARIVDLFPFFESVGNITASNGGANEEEDPAFYERLRDSMETFSTAGPLGAYIYWAKTASARIVDVRPTSPEPGVADIRILLENGEMPDAEMAKLVLDTVNADRVRPFTDYVKVSAPDPKLFDIDLTYFIPDPRADSAALIQAEVERAVQEYITWQTQRMGRDINPDVLIKLIIKAGAKRTVMRSPAFTVVQDTEVAVIGSKDVIYGGIERG